MTSLTKFCTRCEQDLPATTDFFHKAKNACGLYSICKACKKESIKIWMTENPEKVKAYEDKKYARKKESGYFQSEKFRATNKRYKTKCKEANPEKYKQDSKEAFKRWKEANPEKHKQIKQESYRKAVAAGADWTKKTISPELRKKYREKYLENPHNRLIKRLRAIVRKHVKTPFSTKSRTHEILGCSFEDFRSHIENLFTDGMSWDNFSEIHIDHKTPISLAKNEEEAIKLSHYTNLQPLWAKDNLQKGAKLNTVFN